MTTEVVTPTRTVTISVSSKHAQEAVTGWIASKRLTIRHGRTNEHGFSVITLKPTWFPATALGYLTKCMLKANLEIRMHYVDDETLFIEC